MMRLQKIISAAGIVSRRKAEKLIASGRVKVNGKTVTRLGTKVDPALSTVEVDDLTVELLSEKIYYLLNKPRGYLTTVKDPQKRPTVLDLLPKDKGLFPVGRLDKNTEGALLVTNDGETAHRLMHPRYEVSKKYTALVKGEVLEQSLHLLRKGVMIEQGKTSPAQVKLLSKGKHKSKLEITLKEGKKRQVKRMLSAVGHPVLCLKRTSFAFLTLKDLQPGFYRSLTSAEVHKLLSMVGLEK